MFLKKLVTCAVFLIFMSNQIRADEFYLYRVQRNDQLGELLLSLGHRMIWSEKKWFYSFKENNPKLNTNLIIFEDQILKISKEDIIFTENINLEEDNFFTIKKKIKTNEDLIQLMKENNSFTKNSESKYGASYFFGVSATLEQVNSIDRNAATKSRSLFSPGIQIGVRKSYLDLNFIAFKKKSDSFSIPFDYKIESILFINSLLSRIQYLYLKYSFIKKNFMNIHKETPEVTTLNGQFLGFGVGLIYNLFFDVNYSFNNEMYSSTSSWSEKNGNAFLVGLSYKFKLNKRLSHWTVVSRMSYLKFKHNLAQLSLDSYEGQLNLLYHFR